MTLLADTLARLDTGDGWFQYAAGDATGAGWSGIEDILTTPSPIEGWLADLTAGDAKGHRNVAASFLTSWLTGAVTQPVAAAVQVARRAWPVTAANLVVRRHAGGWFDGLTVRGQTVLVLPDDPVAGDRDATVLADVGRLRARVASDVADVLAPIFAAIRERAPYGTRGMWGAVADGIAGDALARARRDRTDGEAAWRDANLLVDAIAARVPPLTARPTLATVDWSGGRAHFAVRGTCCLYFLASGCARDPRGEAYCTSCPFRDGTDRQRRWAAWLEQQAGAEPEAALT